MTSVDPQLPRRTNGVVLDRSEGEVTLRDGAGRALCVANDTAAAIWELCDGRTTVEEMVGAIRQIWQVDTATVTADVTRGLADLEAVGAIESGRGGPEAPTGG